MKLTPAVLALLVGCTDTPEQTTLTSYAYGMGDCPNEDCGLNTGRVNGVYFGNLSLSKKINTSGVQLIGFDFLPVGTTKLDVFNDQLVALNDDHTVVRYGTNLMGAELKLLVNKQEFRLKIVAIHLSEAPWWAANDGTGRVWTYKFQWREPLSSTLTNYCRAEKGDTNALRLDAVVFEHELYTDDTKQRYVPPAGEGWFNIACYGSGVAKEFFMRHTEVSKPLLDNTTPAERQALLNAWTANYCGDGKSWTKTGTPIRMRDNKKWIHPKSGWSWQYDIGFEPANVDPQLASYEAIWDETGARCLNTPRLDDRDDIIAHCEDVGHPIDYCTPAGAVPVGWEAQGHILTANPPASGFVLIAP